MEFIRSETHRRYIASQPCAVCARIDVQAAHIPMGHAGGLSLKASDELTWPLCLECHPAFDADHKGFLEGNNKAGVPFDPYAIARYFAKRSPDPLIRANA